MTRLNLALQQGAISFTHFVEGVKALTDEMQRISQVVSRL
jgi:hypothetical protein